MFARNTQERKRPTTYCAIQELTVPLSEVQFFLELLELLRREQICITPGSSTTVGGFQTPNLMDLNHSQVNTRLERLRRRVEQHLPAKCSLYWAHLIDCATGGYQNPHDHAHNEDYSSVLYLDSGNAATTFYLNRVRKIRTSVAQERGKLCLFLAQLTHEAAVVESSKKVLVCGHRLEG